MNISSYDFTKPKRLDPELQQQLAEWLETGCALAGRQWKTQLPFAATIKCTALETVRAGDALARLAEHAVAHRITVGQDATLMVWPRTAVLALVAGLLGDSTTKVESDSPLTSVECSLWDYFLETTLLEALLAAWSAPQPVRLQLEGREPDPRWSRTFTADVLLVACKFSINGPFGEYASQWLIPIDTLLETLAQASPAPGGRASQTSEPDLQNLVLELPVEVAVILGQAEISLSQLGKLDVGDIVLLNQRVSDPLTASVGGKEHLHGWAGRVGAWKAFHVLSLAHRD